MSEPNPPCPECGSPVPPSRRKFCSRWCCVLSQRAAAKAVAEFRQAGGLCKYCAAPAGGGFLLCPACRAKYRPKIRAICAARRARGVCPRCGRTRRRGYLHCALCLAYGEADREARRAAAQGNRGRRSG